MARHGAPPQGVEPWQVVRLVVEHDVGGWGALGGRSLEAAVQLESSSDTEWHQVLLLSLRSRREDELSASTPEDPLRNAVERLVVHVPSWTGPALESKVLASRAVADARVGPALLADLTAPLGPDGGGEGRRMLVSEFLPGGPVEKQELQSGAAMPKLGRLYGRLHAEVPHTWFDKVLPSLWRAGLLVGSSGGAAAAPVPEMAGRWASCLWILHWLFSMVPPENRAALAIRGVDWELVAAEVAGLPTCRALPPHPTMLRVVTVHGDSHAGNVIRDEEGCPRLIDFDFTARGPAGTEFGFLTLMLFGCGFEVEQVTSREAQRGFARGYLEAVAEADGRGSGGGEVRHDDDDTSLDELLLAMHCWAYAGILKMGLLCAVLMGNKGHESKREVMRARGPELLHPGLLSAARETIARALEGEVAAREALLSNGLFFSARARWRDEGAVS